MRQWFMRRLHVSWHIAWISFGILSGVALSAFLGIEFVGLQIWIFIIALLSVVLINRSIWVIGLAILAGLLLGMWRGTAELQSLNEYQPYYKQQVVLSGKVAEDTVLSSDGNQRVRVGNVEMNEQGFTGQVWVSTSSTVDIKRGDLVDFRGTLNEGFGNFPAAMFRAQLVKAKRPHPGDIAREVRDWFAEGIRTNVAEPEASLGIGYLVGQRSTLPEDLDENLRILGLTHVVVASGYNLTILVRFARRAFAGVSKYLAALSAGTMITSFILVTGLSPSMSRAGLVAGLSLIAWYYGRKIHPLVLLPFSAAITVLINPSYIWGDIGWYLSFTSFAGVIMLAPLIQAYFWGESNKPRVLRQILVETMSAQIITMPIIAYTFSQYAPLAIPANLLILPLIPLAMVATFFAGVAGVLSSALPWFGLPANFILSYMTSITNWMANLPIARGEIVFDVKALIIMYLCILAVMFWFWHKNRYNFADYNVVE